MKTCGHEQFHDVQQRLVAEGRSFTVEEMRKLCYGSIFMATIGNAGKAIGKSEDAAQVEKERQERFAGLSPEELTKQTFCDSHEAYGVFRKLAAARGILPDAEASPEILLYRNMVRLRSNWSGGRGSYALTQIYALVKKCQMRENLPIGWLAAVKVNADTFDGHFNDGRIMRDGQLLLPEEARKALGLPAEMAGGVSGNMAKMMGAVPAKDHGYLGSYEELWNKILEPDQRVEFLRECPEDED